MTKKKYVYLLKHQLLMQIGPELVNCPNHLASNEDGMLLADFAKGH